uniref:Glycosyl transferase family 11 n=1 Tax=Candidatus Kentrum sp. TUN TaxID=2126343 RepID=A0A450ZT75_9GAMM|nr:MAG: Glycosyl transferase family 11 [Candidatus Kentron sp. TUN]VFK64708.1 MAG: Glycosyl transferase family 11 [Candidatus Kentron sp. TUN]
MIITHLFCGLGNQMFQYAAGRALSLRHGVPLAIDRRGLDLCGRSYGLHRFALQAMDADPKHLPEPEIHRLPKQFKSEVCRNIFKEEAFRFYPEVLDLPDGTYLVGFWQSERYFQDAEDIIRRDFLFRDPPSPINAEYLKRIQKGISISVHIRRGDYLQPEYAQIGTCSLDYYRRAAKLIQEQVGSDAKFYLFSDDSDWVRDNVRFHGEMHIVRHNDVTTDFEDLRLMSACSHHIIANSTFSWWAAWLNPSVNKIVVAPARWFRTDEADYRAVVPDRWWRI